MCPCFEWVESWPSNSLVPRQGRPPAPGEEVCPALGNNSPLSVTLDVSAHFPRWFAWEGRKGMGWGVKCREVGLGPEGVFVQGDTRAHKALPVLPACSPCSKRCGLGEVGCKDSLIIK